MDATRPELARPGPGEPDVARVAAPGDDPLASGRAEPLEIWLEAAGVAGRAQGGAELSLQGASVRLREPLAIGGEQVELVFCARDLERPIRLAARVLHVIAFRDHWSYGLEFVQAQRLRERLPPRLYRLFQLHCAPRAVLDREPIEVRVSRPRCRDAWARLLDISTSGMAVNFAHGDPELASGELVNVSFQLGADQMQLVQRVRRGVMGASGARYGLEFEEALTPQFERQSERIERFIAGATRVVHGPASLRLPRPALRHWAERVRPAANETVSVDVAVLHRREAPVQRTARLRDISTSGMGVALPAAQDLGLSAGEDALLRCNLNSGASVALVSRVRRTLLIDDEVCYGLEFDHDRTRDSATSHVEIATFVARHRNP